MFKELFIGEMASKNGIGQEGSSRRSEWSNRNEKFVELLKDKLPGKTRFYKYDNTYYLTDSADDYIGFIEINDETISKSHREPNRIKSSFYEFMFGLILSDLKVIKSDDSLSKSAIQSYENLSKTAALNLKLSDGTKFDKDKLLSNRRLFVVIKESNDGIIDYIFESYYKKINQKTDLGSHKRPGDWAVMYEENDEILFSILFDN